MEADDETTQLRYAHALAALGRRRRLRRRGALGHRDGRRARHRRTSGCKYRELSDAVRRRAEAAGAGGAAARARTRCCCSTSRTTTSTCRASGGWRSGCADTPRPCCSSATTGSCWPGSPTGSSPSRAAPAWVHGGGFATYHEARPHRHERLAELRRRWEEEHERLKRAGPHPAAAGEELAPTWPRGTRRCRPGWPSSRRAGRRRTGPRSRTSRCGCAAAAPAMRAVTCERLELTGLMQPFDLEVFYGERVAVLGSNGSGKSHFLRLLGGEPVGAHAAPGKLGARVVPGPVRPDPRPPGVAGPDAGRPALARRAGPAGRGPRPGDGRAAPLRAARARPTSASARCPAASRRGSRSCCWSCPARPCCCWTSRPTTSTCVAPRRWRRRWRRSTARCWR